MGWMHSIPQRNSPDWIQRNTTITPPHPQPITTTTSTNHTPIAQPHTTSSCELTATKWGKTGRFLPHEVLECSRASTKWTSRVVANKGLSLLEVGLLRARAQTKVGEVRDPKGLFRTLPSLRKNTLRVSQPIRYSQTLPQLTAISQIFPNNTTYHLMVP